MSTLHKVKAYFGMAPMDDYDDEYFEEEDRPGRSYARRGREERFEDDSAPVTTGTRTVTSIALSPRAWPGYVRMLLAAAKTATGRAG